MVLEFTQKGYVRRVLLCALISGGGPSWRIASAANLRIIDGKMWCCKTEKALTTQELLIITRDGPKLTPLP